jgi:putative spermidine/putrescine transport system substrate-binding protein
MHLLSCARGFAVVAALLVTVAGASIAACGDDDGEEGRAPDVTLAVGSWGGASDDGTREAYLDPFESESGVGFRMVPAPGEQLARVEAQNRAGEIEWDVLDGVAGDGAFVLAERGYLENLPRDVKSQLENAIGPEKVTPFGFAHGNIANVIVCNMDRVETCPKDMAAFYDTERFPQDRMFAGIAPIMAVTTAQVASGVPRSKTSTTPLDMDSAFESLESLKPKIRVFWESGDQQEQIMRSGAADIGIMWSNRAHRLKTTGMNLQINWAGAAYEPSYWTVLKGARNQGEAFDLLTWIATHPRAQAKWAEAVGSSVPNDRAFDFLEEDLIVDFVDQPANFEKIAVPNFEWYAKNTKRLDDRYRDFVRGG